MTLLQPLIALAAWTMVVWLWMYATRLPAMSQAKVDPDSLARDPDQSLDKVLPPSVQWKAHNYNHLHEAPTIFYAVSLSLVLLEMSGKLALGLASAAYFLSWTYVGLRIVHSLVQVTINKVVIRFALFFLSQTALLGLVVTAAIAVFSDASDIGAIP